MSITSDSRPHYVDVSVLEELEQQLVTVRARCFELMDLLREARTILVTAGVGFETYGPLLDDIRDALREND
jgi:hypothetical protein